MSSSMRSPLYASSQPSSSPSKARRQTPFSLNEHQQQVFKLFLLNSLRPSLAYYILNFEQYKNLLQSLDHKQYIKQNAALNKLEQKAYNPNSKEGAEELYGQLGADAQLAIEKILASISAEVTNPELCRLVQQVEQDLALGVADPEPYNQIYALVLKLHQSEFEELLDRLLSPSLYIKHYNYKRLASALSATQKAFLNHSRKEADFIHLNPEEEKSELDEEAVTVMRPFEDQCLGLLAKTFYNTIYLLNQRSEYKSLANLYHPTNDQSKRALIIQLAYSVEEESELRAALKKIHLAEPLTESSSPSLEEQAKRLSQIITPLAEIYETLCLKRISAKGLKSARVIEAILEGKNNLLISHGAGRQAFLTIHKPADSPPPVLPMASASSTSTTLSTLSASSATPSEHEMKKTVASSSPSTPPKVSSPSMQASPPPPNVRLLKMPIAPSASALPAAPTFNLVTLPIAQPAHPSSSYAHSSESLRLARSFFVACGSASIQFFNGCYQGGLGEGLSQALLAFALSLTCSYAAHNSPLGSASFMMLAHRALQEDFTGALMMGVLTGTGNLMAESFIEERREEAPKQQSLSLNAKR